MIIVACSFCFLALLCLVTFGNMASDGLRANSLSTVTNFDAGQNASNSYSLRQ